MSKQKTLGVLVEKVPGVPAAYRAGIVWGAMPLLAGVEEGPTPEAAVAALEDAVRRLGYDPTVIVFDTLEAPPRPKGAAGWPRRTSAGGSGTSAPRFPRSSPGRTPIPTSATAGSSMT